MTYAHVTRPASPRRPAIQAASDKRCGIAPHRGDVTTVRAAAHVRLQEAKRVERLQAHGPARRTAGTDFVPVVIPGIGRA